MLRYFKTLVYLLCCLPVIFIQQNAAYGQGFNLPNSTCPNENINFTSPSPSAPHHFWDFCPGDLVNSTGTGSIISTGLAGATRVLDVATVFDGTNWYSFMPDFNNNGVARAFYGNSLDNTPTITNLTSFNASLGLPCGMDIINDNGTWYGLIANFGGNSLVRVNFGSSLDNNSPTVDVIADGSLAFPTHLAVVKDGSSYKAVVSNWQKNLVIVDFGSTVANAPSFSATPNLLGNGNTDSGGTGNGMWGFNLTKGDDGNWYGIAVTHGSGYIGPMNINYVEFGATINNTPTISLLDSQIPNYADISAAGAGQDVAIVRDGNRIYAFVQTNLYNIVQIDFGEKISDPTPTVRNLGGYNTLARVDSRETFGFSVNKDKSNWYIYVCNIRNNGATSTAPFFIKIKLDNPTNCSNSMNANASTVNSVNQYVLPNKYFAELNTFDANMEPLDYYIDSITVNASITPQFNFSNQCLGETTTFTNNSIGLDSDVNAWEWSFGDGSVSSLKNPTHQYTTPGTYTISLIPRTVSGECENAFTQTIVIKETPTANFEITDTLAAGTNIEFNNTSIIPNETISTSYLWLFDDGTFSILKNPSHTFSKPGVYNVSLTVTDSTDGCSAIVSQAITIGAIPQIGFTTNDLLCTKTPITFTDTSSVSDNVGSKIVSYFWNFGAAGTSTEKSPTIVFDFAETYEITLLVTTNLGVVDSIKRTLSFQEGITSQITASVTSGEAPLSVNFANQNSNATSYLWNFGDGNTSTEANPTYVFSQPGIYNVTFKAFAANGCSIAATQQIIASASNAVTEVQLNSTSIFGDQVLATITNNGNTPLTSLEIRGILNKQDTVTWQWTGIINSREVTTLSFPLAIGQGDITWHTCVNVLKVNNGIDLKTTDNRLCKNTLDVQTSSVIIRGNEYLITIRNNEVVPIKKLIIQLDLGNNQTVNTEWNGSLEFNTQTNILGTLTAEQLSGSLFLCANITSVNDTTDAIALNNIACQDFADQFQILNINPNPAIDFINIDYYLPQSQTRDVVQLRIANSAGQIMGVAQLLNLIPGRNTYQYDASRLGSGLYYLTFIRGNRTITQKVVIR